MDKKIETLWALLILTSMNFTSCTVRTPMTHLPSNHEMAFDLLIEATDMPPGWIRYEPFNPLDDYCSKDCAVVYFYAVTKGQYSAAQFVYIYDGFEDASEVYATHLKPSLYGETPLNWTFLSESANDSGFACYQYEGKDFPLCKYVAQYGRCDVEFGVWLVPGWMSLDDLDIVVRIIDQIMSISECLGTDK